MYAKRTLENYIKRCEDTIESKDQALAQGLEHEIISVFTELSGIKEGLTFYSRKYVGPREGYVRVPTDFLYDVKLLKNKLQAELDKYSDELLLSQSHDDVLIAGALVGTGAGVGATEKTKSSGNTEDTVAIDSVTEGMNKERKQPKIFISHNSENADYAEAFVQLFKSMGIKSSEIVCSSNDNCWIPMGEDIYDYLSKQFRDYDLHMIFLLSYAYYHSPASLNEMGATWVLKNDYDTIILPGFTFKEIDGAVNPRQIGMDLNCDDKSIRMRALELRERIYKKFNKEDRFDEREWTSGLEEFIEKIDTLRSKEPIEECVTSNGSGDTESTEATQTESTDEVDDSGHKIFILNDVAINFESQILLAYASGEAFPKIHIITDIRGKHIQVGRFEFTDGTSRSFAEWKSRINDLENAGLIENFSQSGKPVYQLTEDGYTLADKLITEYDIDITADPNQYLSDWDLEPLSDLEDTVYAFIKHHNESGAGISKREIIEGTGKSNSSVGRALESLVGKKKVVFKGPVKVRRYLAVANP